MTPGANTTPPPRGATGSLEAAPRSPAAHWAEAFFLEDHPWESGGEGPHAFNCWGLLRHVQREYYGRDLPPMLVDAGDAKEVHRVAGDLLRSGAWRRVDTPIDGDGVLMRSGSDVHVGVWLEVDGGGVLHCVRHSGMRWSRLDHLRTAGFGRIEFYHPAAQS